MPDASKRRPSKNQRKAVLSASKDAMGYDESPPACRTCTYMDARTTLANSAKPIAKVSVMNWCNKGKFIVRLHSVCDHWQSTRGEVLEDAPIDAQPYDPRVRML